MLLLLLACTGDTVTMDDTHTDTADTADSQDQVVWPEGLAELAVLSDGACPDLSASGTSTFSSSGDERKVTVLLPEAGVTAETSVVFFLHGLLSPDQTPNPTEEMASGLGLQSIANSEDMVIVLPEAPIREYFGQRFFLWDVEQAGDTDIVLYDDLRTCVFTELTPDPASVHLMGFSGGALESTVWLSQRGDTFASVVEMSGGANVDVLGNLGAKYETPASKVPVLAFSGGETDVWPSVDLVLVDFGAATDTLVGELTDDEHAVVRCEHDQGHTLTQAQWNLSLEWVVNHRFGAPSPWTDGTKTVDTSWCE